jgi:HAD superfamily hydrolase (TIGR01509 family)
MGAIKAAFFDMDGVIVDTERDGHRRAFNLAFKEFGFADEWSVDYYHQLLQIGGGKERLKHHLETRGFSRAIPAGQADDLVRQMHQRKTAIFVELIESGQLPLRPGIHRFMQEAVDAGLKTAVCTTSNEKAANAIVQNLLTGIRVDIVLAGDVVSRKKPDPEIYRAALRLAALKPEQAFAVEDSRNGVLSAKGAGLKVLVTTNYYTETEDVNDGDIIVTSLGDPGGKQGELRKGDLDFDGVLRLNQVAEYFAG